MHEADSPQHPVLLTEPPLNPRSNRDTAAQILFETFNVPALYTSIQAVLSLYASGRTTGVVLDAGDGVSHAVPVYQGFTVPSSIRRIDVAGRDVTEYLQTLLRKSGYVFHTSAEKEVVRLIKEAVTYVAKDPRKEEKEWAAAKLDQGRIAEYVLPDGNKLKVCCPFFRNPGTQLTLSLLRKIDRRRTLPRTRDPVRPRNHRPRVPRRAPDRGGRHQPDGPRPAQGPVLQHCAVGRQHADQGLRRPAAVRGAARRRQGHEDKDLCAPRAQVLDLDRRQHSGRLEHV